MLRFSFRRRTLTLRAVSQMDVSRRCLEERHKDDLEALERARATLAADHARELQQLGDERQAEALRHERDLNELRAATEERVAKMQEEMSHLATLVEQVSEAALPPRLESHALRDMAWPRSAESSLALPFPLAASSCA